MNLMRARLIAKHQCQQLYWALVWTWYVGWRLLLTGMARSAWRSPLSEDALPAYQLGRGLRFEVYSKDWRQPAPVLYMQGVVEGTPRWRRGSWELRYAVMASGLGTPVVQHVDLADIGLFPPWDATRYTVRVPSDGTVPPAI